MSEPAPTPTGAAPRRPRPEDLRAVDVLADLADDQLAWIAERAEDVALTPGEVSMVEGAPADHLYMLLAGEIEGRREKAPGDDRVFTVRAGEVSGVLPFSRMTHFPVTGRATRPSRVVRFPKALFRDLLARVPELEERLVALMTDRVRETTRRDERHEKLLALGKLSAGLAHELNNPAAATRRAAADLKDRLGAMRRAAAELAARGLTNEDRAVLCELADAVESRAAGSAPLGALERADRESAVGDWLEERGVERSWLLASTFVAAGLSPDDLAALAARLPPEAGAAALVWLEGGLAAAALVADIENASRRISELVGAVKSYSHMDRGTGRSAVDLAREIDSTITMLSYKARQKGIALSRDYDPALPPVEAYAGELNQVWTNLLDNAIDALGQRGTIEISTRADGDCAVVEIADDGPGIPEEERERVFGRFVRLDASREQASGSAGLGLAIAREIATAHGATIVLTEAPGGGTRAVVTVGSTAGAATETTIRSA